MGEGRRKMRRKREKTCQRRATMMRVTEGEEKGKVMAVMGNAG